MKVVSVIEMDQVRLKEKYVQKEETENSAYKPCFNCERHPSYPNIPPITLHRDNKCLICNEISKDAS